jgi:hypothetical protein
MSLSIYNIEQEFLSLSNEIIEAGGEITPELETALAINKEQLQNKGINYGYVIKSLESDITSIDEEIKRLQALKQSRTKTTDLLKNTIKEAMILYGIEELKTPTLKINFRKSESVEVESDIIDDEFCTFKTTRTPDKAKIKEAIKNGEAVIGASLKINRNIQIK